MPHIVTWTKQTWIKHHNTASMAKLREERGVARTSVNIPFLWRDLSGAALHESVTENRPTVRWSIPSWALKDLGDVGAMVMDTHLANEIYCSSHMQCCGSEIIFQDPDLTFTEI